MKHACAPGVDLTHLFEKGTVGMFVADGGRRIVAANPALCRILGFEAGALGGAAFADITHADDEAESRGMADSLLRGDVASYQLRKRYLGKDGRTIWANVHVMKMPVPQVVRVFGIVDDITEFKQGEERLRQVLSRRHDVSIAVGLVMERERATSQDAFALLRAHARNRRRKLLDVAHEVVRSAETLNGLRIPAKASEEGSTKSS